MAALPDELVRYYTEEACSSLALALNERTGWQLAILWDDGTFDDWGAGSEPTPAHVFCIDPHGRAVDGRGVRPLAELRAEFACDLVEPSIDERATRGEVEALMGDGRPLYGFDPDARAAAAVLLHGF